MKRDLRPGAIVLVVGAIAVLFALAGWASSAEPAKPPIDGPSVAAPGDLVILEATVDAKSYQWMLVGSSKRWLATDGGKRVVFASGTPGFYTFALATASGDVVGLYQHTVQVGEASPPNPPLPPPPQPGANPWQPAAAWQPSTATIRAIKLSRDDATRLAEVYGSLSRPANLASLATTGDLRASLVKGGSSLGLRGKYPGLAEAVDGYLAASIRLENVPLNRDVASQVLATLAWAVWECGRQ